MSSIIDGMAATKKEITTKSIVDAFAYVRCPHCWSRVYRSNNILVSEPAEVKENEADDNKKTDSAIKTEEEKKDKSADEPTVPSSSFWAALTAATIK